jgi:predicted SAM-dependent methyltransferase
VKLNLGCGPVQPPAWTNVDGSNRAWLASRLPWIDRALVAAGLLQPTEFNAQTVHTNLLRRFPWRDETVDAIYMGELLEHFTKDDAEHVLSECRRVLRQGGVIRVRVPDHARFWSNYVRQYEQTKRRPRTEWSLDHTRWTSMYFQDLCVRRPPPWQSMGHFHKWMYDEVSLIILLESIGFQHAVRKPYLESAIPQIEEVEVRDDLIVEAVRG